MTIRYDLFFSWEVTKGDVDKRCHNWGFLVLQQSSEIINAIQLSIWCSSRNKNRKMMQNGCIRLYKKGLYFSQTRLMGMLSTLLSHNECWQFLIGLLQEWYTQPYQKYPNAFIEAVITIGISGIIFLNFTELSSSNKWNLFWQCYYKNTWSSIFLFVSFNNVPPLSV